MGEATVSTINSRSLLTLFGARDEHLKQIRDQLGVQVRTGRDTIYIEGDQEAVAKATEVLEHMKQIVDRQGALEKTQVTQLLAGVAGDSIRNIPPIDIYNLNKSIRPKTAGQKRLVQAIDENDIVFCVGPAGTGKTFLSVAMAVSALKREQIRKLVLVRPAVEAGESLGFLPGDLQAKINPYLRPLLDALAEMMDFEQIKRYTEQDIIEMIPLAYMRGRTLNEAFIILDEAQNTTAAQMKMFLTRMGMGSKIVIAGDATQTDLPAHKRSGLADALARLRGIRGVSQVQMHKSDVVRHRLVQEIVRAYEEGSQPPSEGTSPTTSSPPDSNTPLEPKTESS
ncbi:Phosphate starvation-inducible protein PhoH [Planctomycetales bacterium 10988]|nr:Phosphate starvation-inducible protein PhoH [Planctomycetales bacterium 10988]